MLTRRRYERVPFFCPLQLTKLQDEAGVAASSLDISIGGVGLMAPVAIERGTLVRVRFHLHDESIKDLVEDVLGKVAYSRADEDGNRIGIEFLETIRETTHPSLTRRLNSL